ncbi:MAG: O-antigen ligase family protein [Actinomycetota bacterium]
MTATTLPTPPARPQRRRLFGSGANSEVSAATEAELRELGVLAVFALRVFLVAAPTGMFYGLWEWGNGGIYQQMVYALPAFGALVIAPRRAMLRIPVSVSLILLLGWMMLSYLWTIDEAQTSFQLRQQVSLCLAAVIAVGLLPLEETFKWFLRGVKLLLLISLLATIFDSGTRVSIEFGSVLSAWEAWFPSKNNLGRFLVFAVAVILWIDKSFWSRVVWCSIAVGLAVGANSATAVGALFLLAGFSFWISRYRKLGDEFTGVFTVVSLFVGLVGIITAFAALAIIVEALGRDLTFTGRTDIWDGVLPLVEDRLWYGYGHDALWTLESPESRGLARAVGFPPAHAHNSVLNTLAGVGMPGLLLYFSLFISTLTASLRHLRTSPVAAWSLSFLMLIIVFGSVEAVFLTDWLPALVMARVAVAKLSRERRARDEQEVTAVDLTRPDPDADAATRGYDPVGVIKPRF